MSSLYKKCINIHKMMVQRKKRTIDQNSNNQTSW